MRLEKMKLSSIVIRLKVMVADSFRLLIGILLFLLLFFLGSQSAFAATLQNAHITADTVWVASSSPYIVTENIEIKPEVTLTIEPGVVVKVDVSRSIVVHGIQSTNLFRLLQQKTIQLVETVTTTALPRSQLRVIGKVYGLLQRPADILNMLQLDMQGMPIGALEGIQVFIMKVER
jgi:hypothetical protein